MSSVSHHHGTNIITEKKKRGLLLSTRMSWTQLDEDFPVPKATADHPLSISHLVDPNEENLCNWMDSGFYLSASKDLQENRDKAAAFSPPSGMVQMTVQNYMRITEWLDFWEKDPVEVLLDLGFGRDEPDICTKIPSRFISCASMAKGINIRVFIEAQRQRMDVESPDLYGRFRQLQVLDHVTSAFSSLLNDVNAMQHKLEEGNREEEKSTGEAPKGKLGAAQAKRRRLGQLLRKVSRQTTMHSPQIYRMTGPFKAKDNPSDADTCLATRTGLVDNTALISLKEERFPSEEVVAMTASHLPQPRANKSWLLPHLPIKQPHLPSASEMLTKDRSRKESNLRLAHRLSRRVPGLSWKPSDSFEMEEIQSFEDESSWGNPPESTSVTRTNSCQSDSSGFLDDPLEPLQGVSLPGHVRLGCNPHDCHAFLRYRKDSALTSQDLQPYAEGPVASTSTADARNSLLLASLSREHTFPGEEVFYSINEEDDDLYETFSGQSESAEMDEEEMQGRGGELGRGDSCVQDCVSCRPTDNMNWVDENPPERNCLPDSSEMHQTVGSAPAKESCIIFDGLSGGQIFEDRKGCEEPVTEKEEIRDLCKEHILNGTAVCVEGKLHDKKASRKLQSPIPVTDITSDCWDVNLDGTLTPLDRTRTSNMEHDVIGAQPEIDVSSRSSLQDASLSPHCLTNEKINSLDILSTSTQPDEDGCVPGLETNANPLKSVTVQMPSRLMSSIQSISLGESTVHVQSMDFTSKVSQCSKDESLMISAQPASKGEAKQTKEASIQTDRSQRKTGALPLFHRLPSFHGHGHLVKSASVDTGLYGKYRSYCHEPLNAWCSLSSHHCCLKGPFPFAPTCKHPMACCSSCATIELQLLKTLKLLQDTARRNISACTVHEIEVMRNSCQKFRERLDEIEHHLTEQEALFSGAMSKEGREERRQLQDLRQAVRREVAELECQLQDRARQVREGILMQLDQLLGEQSHLCSELGISGWWEERNARDGHALPDAAVAAFTARDGCSKDIHHRPPSRSATIPSSPSASLLRQTELQVSASATGKTRPASEPKELHTSRREIKGPPQPKIDFKAFLQNLKKSFRNSFSNDATEGRD